MKRHLLLFVLAAASLATTGCGGAAPDRPVQVTGQVLLDGQPLAEGEISFVQEGEPPTMLNVTQGRFEGQVKPGKRRVEIRRYELYQPPPMGGVVLPPNKQNNLPARYNDNSKLTADVQAQGPNEFKFEVKAK